MEWIKNTIEYGSLFLSVWVLVVITNEVLREYQNQGYALKKFYYVWKYFYVQDRTQLLFPLAVFFFYMDNWIVQLIYSGYLAFLILWKWLQKSEPTQAYGNRLTRLFAFMIVLDTVAATLLHLVWPLPQLMSSLIVLMMTAPILVFVAAMLLQPLEWMLMQTKSKKRGLQ